MKEIVIDKKARIRIIVAALVLVAVIGAGIYILSFTRADRPVTGVLLETGDIYFGKLSYFPRLTLTDVYVVQSTVDPLDPTQITYQVISLRLSIWGPSKINLNYDKIVFMGRVGENSQVMQAIRGQSQ